MRRRSTRISSQNKVNLCMLWSRRTEKKLTAGSSSKCTNRAVDKWRTSTMTLRNNRGTNLEMTIISFLISRKKEKIGKISINPKLIISRNRLLIPLLKSSFLDTKLKSKITNFTLKVSFREGINLPTSIRTTNTSIRILIKLITTLIIRMCLTMRANRTITSNMASGTNTKTTTLLIKTTSIENQFN